MLFRSANGFPPKFSSGLLHLLAGKHKTDVSTNKRFSCKLFLSQKPKHSDQITIIDAHLELMEMNIKFV